MTVGVNVNCKMSINEQFQSGIRKGIVMKKQKKGFSKKLLIADYTVTTILIVAFFICVIFNGVYTTNTINRLVEVGLDPSYITIVPPFNLDGFGVFFGAWTAQLGVSSYAYYSLVKRERKMEMPMKLLEDLPQDIKERLDMTTIITTVLSCTND